METTKTTIDRDVRSMSLGERGAEIMRLRAALRRRRDAKNNAKCWILDEQLYAALPETKHAGGITLPREVFLRNCARYYDRETTE